MGLFSRAKNAALETAVRGVLQSRLERYGQLTQLSINSDERCFDGEIVLRGETDPMTISDGHYRIEERGGETYVVVYGVKVSREWAQNAIDDHMPEVSVKVPDFLKSLL